MMREIVEAVIAGKWFTGDLAPFKCQITWGHPKLVIITGPNAAGKSVLRKIIHNQVADRKMTYFNYSQEGKAQSHGLQRLMIYGTETDESTGYNSVKSFTKCLQSIKAAERPCFAMIDEPEIGCSEEVQAGIGLRLAQETPDMDNTMPNVGGIFVVTHSRQLIKHALPANPTHWRLSDDGMTFRQFVEREIVPADLDELLALGKETWHKVRACKGTL